MEPWVVSAVKSGATDLEVEIRENGEDELGRLRSREGQLYTCRDSA